MKKISIITVLSFFTSIAFSQTQKGNVLIGANLSNISLNFQKGNTQFGFNLTPKAGWFIKDNTLLGAEVNLGLATQKGATSVNYGVGGFGRKYFGSEASSLTKTTKWFLEANAGIYGTNLSGDNIISTSTNGLGVGAGPGIAYFLSQNIALEALAKYNITVGFGNSTTNNNLEFGLGFQIYLPGKRVEQLIDNPVK
jgi:hypothetical protein